MANPVCLPDLSPNRRSLPPRIPQAAHRHAAPSGPWPWSDLVDGFDVPSQFMLPSFDRSATADPENDSRAHDWKKYPSHFFPNWTRHRLERSGIAAIIDQKVPKYDADCVIYHIDVGTDGHFSHPGQHTMNNGREHEFWDIMTEKRPPGNRLRLLFVENLSGIVLQMLGTMYKIEPFFFSSSLNWIPARYQEDVKSNYGDHITITLTFLRTMPNPMTDPNTPFSQIGSPPGMTIDTQAPLVLRSNDRVLLLDLLAFHVVRGKDGGTVISYHPTPEWKSTSARYLHSRVRYAGESVYWQSIFRRSEDPTFVLLCMLWYPLYAWDESLENLYVHICWLESRVLIPNDIHLTRELHIIRASLLHYASLLENFRKTVLFLRDTTNPGIQDSDHYTDSMVLMSRECDTLLSEIERVEMFRKMQEMRLKNAINLAFATVNFQDSRDTQRLSEASLRDGGVMKQISYLTMVFLPASFVATVFGMNLQNLQQGSRGTLAHYFAVAVPLTCLTIWIIVGLHASETQRQEVDTSVLYRLGWPIRSAKRMFISLRKKRQRVSEGVV